MKKRLKFALSFFLILIIAVSSLCMPASSYENDVEASTADIILINLDTNTVVYSKKPDNMWYSGYLSVLMTYLLASEKIADPDKTTFKVERDFIDELPYTDGSLDKYVGKTLTASDLMALTLLTSGSDTAYALAYLTNGSDLSGFVKMMNDRAKELGCTNTGYISPGYSNSSDQFTTCRDTARLYAKVRETDIFAKVFKENSYIPTGYGEKDAVVSEASMLNSKSPYYFKYTNDAKFSYTSDTYANLALTTTYHNMTYLFVGLLGLNESERNVYADARKLTTWAYLNLSDRKVINSDSEIAKVNVKSGWGSYDVPLYTYNSAYKTLPNEFDEKLFSVKTEVPDEAALPLLQGQKVGSAVISYDKEQIDKVDLVVDHDEGLGMLSDFARFSGVAFDSLFSNKPVKETTATEGTESAG